MADDPFPVTVTSTTPLPAGEMAVIRLSELTEKLVAAVLPNDTLETSSMPLPVMTTVFPPDRRPLDGEIIATVGVAS